jgi:hypothetical protein
MTICEAEAEHVSRRHHAVGVLMPACIPSHVAAASTMPTELWVDLPGSEAKMAARGVAAIQERLNLPEPQRDARRACAHYAAGTGQWDVAAREHAAWMRAQPA